MRIEHLTESREMLPEEPITVHLPVRSSGGPRRIIAKKGKEYTLFRFEDIACFFVEKGVTYLIDRKSHSKYITTGSLRDLEMIGNAAGFFRVTKKYLVNIDVISRFRASYKGKIELFLNSLPDEQILISQLKAKQFKKWILEN
jgi:DNA-binding LytR/AlgR family response regulator